MTTYKLTAPNDVTVRIGGHLDNFWMILGEAYTDRRDIAEHLAAREYTVEEVDEIPADHAAKVARLTAWPYPIIVGQADGADPDQKYRFEDHHGDWRDIRDLVSGALTLKDSTHAGHAPLVHLDPTLSR